MIENEFPTREISRLAIPERSSYKPIYQISKWFARRASSTFRAILLSACYTSSEAFMERFYAESSLSDVVIMDPFMGGGTTIIEGLRLGMKCIGVDINPIAWFITKSEAELVDISKLEVAIDKCKEKLEKRIKKWYMTQCPNCDGNADIIYVHWVKQLECPYCEKKIPLFRNFIVVSNIDNIKLICPSCNLLFSKDHPLDDSLRCPECNFSFLPKVGYRIGRSSCVCPSCGESSNLTELNRLKTSSLSSLPYAIEGYCPNCAKTKDSSLAKTNYKFVKGITQLDVDLFNEADVEWKKTSGLLLHPMSEIPFGTSTKVLLNHNYRKWKDMFNNRQLLSLSLILTYIETIKDTIVQELLLAAFLNLLNHNNVFTRYSPKGRKVEGVFARHDFHPLSTFAENNVWGTKYGRGTWLKCLRRLVKGKEFNIAPYNFKRTNLSSGKADKKKIFSGKIDGKLNSQDRRNFSKINGNLILLCQDANTIPSFKEPVDLIISDPPYADNVNYAELSDFLYVWIRLVLKERYPFFIPLATPKEEEAIESKTRKTNYFEKLGSIFKVCSRSLRPNGLFIFTFHHSDPNKWFQLAESIDKANLRVVKTHVIPSEAKNVLNIQKKKGITFDLIIVSKAKDKKPRNLVELEIFIKELANKFRKEMDRNFESGFDVQEPNDIVVFFGVLLELFFQKQPVDASNRPVNSSDLWRDSKAELSNLLRVENP
ncbi:MAG: DNA methyltransferase [Candidatus Hodarchaeales archaeon]